MMVNVSLPTSDQSRPTLWQNTYSGMSVGEVQQAQPNARKSSDPEPLYSGATPELEIPGFRVSGAPYRVLFYFERGALCQVTLQTEAHPNVSAAEALLPLLCSKYGEPFLFEPPIPGDPLPSLHAEWSAAAGVKVTLVCFEGAALNIVYQAVGPEPDMATELAKL
jgi:hypothetical protein